jgi:hypothetical protein
MNKE